MLPILAEETREAEKEQQHQPADEPNTPELSRNQLWIHDRNSLKRWPGARRYRCWSAVDRWTL